MPGKDEVLVEGKDGYVVTYGEMTYRAWDAVLRVRRDGTDVGFINKSTLNVVDEDVGLSLLLTPSFLPFAQVTTNVDNRRY